MSQYSSSWKLVSGAACSSSRNEVALEDRISGVGSRIFERHSSPRTSTRSLAQRMGRRADDKKRRGRPDSSTWRAKG